MEQRCNKTPLVDIIYWENAIKLNMESFTIIVKRNINVALEHLRVKIWTA